MEYIASAEQGESSIILDYGGTYKSFPVLQADFYKENEADGDSLSNKGDCGYVAFFTEDEKIVQLGDPDEEDIEGNAYQSSQTLVNSKFDASSSWGTAAENIWAVNSGITSSDAVVQTGSFTINTATEEVATTPATVSEKILTASSKEEHPYIHYTITATATNRTATSVKLDFSIGTRLDNTNSFFGNGYKLKGTLFGELIGEKSVIIKETSDYWKGNAFHYKNVSVVLNNLTAAATEFECSFAAVREDTSGGKSGILTLTACKTFNIPTYTEPTPATLYLCPLSLGSGSDWHGPSITRVLPADSSGEVGAKNFKLSYSQKMAIGWQDDATKQYGAFQVLAVSGSGANRKIVAGVNVYKGTAGKSAKLRFYLNGKVIETTDIDLSNKNKYFTAATSSTITKVGRTVNFNIGGHIQKQYSDDAIADVAVTEITFTLSKFGTRPRLSSNGLYWAKFVKDYCETRRDIPNKFSANDVVEADCRTGEILLNGAAEPSLGALGNDFEGFYLTPGINQIGLSHSHWVEAAYAPQFKVRYREVFL
jgi:hypothetical protein